MASSRGQTLYSLSCPGSPHAGCKLEATTGHDPLEIVVLLRPACTPITPACESTCNIIAVWTMMHLFYLMDGKPHIPMPMRMAIKALMSSMVTGCLDSS